MKGISKGVLHALGACCVVLLLSSAAIAADLCIGWRYGSSGPSFDIPYGACRASYPLIPDHSPTFVKDYFRVELTSWDYPYFLCNVWYRYTDLPGEMAQAGYNLELDFKDCSYFVRAEVPDGAECASGCPSSKVGDPVDPANGAVTKIFADYKVGRGGGVAFQRFFDSKNSQDSTLGKGWQGSYSRRVKQNKVAGLISRTIEANDPDNSSPYATKAAACESGFAEIRARVPNWVGATAHYVESTCLIEKNGIPLGSIPVYSNNGLPFYPEAPKHFDVVRDDGQSIRFWRKNGLLQTNPGVLLRLQETPAGFQIRDEKDNIEMYNAAGRLLSVTSRSGVTKNMGYDSNGNLLSVVDSFGSTLTFGRDQSGRVSSVTQGGLTTRYSYASGDLLSKVTFPDSTTNTYVYEDSAYPESLTGVIDENNQRLSTWVYDAEGRGKSTFESGGANRVDLDYNADDSVTVTDALGAVRLFSYSRVGDRKFVSSISGSQCPTCSEGKATTYNGAGWVSSRTDYNDNVTIYSYDNGRGLETSRTEAYGTANARTITTQWHSQYRLPIQIDEPGRRTTFTHYPNGDVQSVTVLDTATSTSRTSSYTYNSFGKVLTIDGPRTDVNDLTLFSYYNCTTGFECGQVSTITNALGQIVKFDSYNAFGQPLSVTDENQVQTSLTYDSRQRLTSSTTAGEQISFEYWPTGLLKKITLPDLSFVLYGYDAAHRLTSIQDSEGNKIVYTLDLMGNRTKTELFDPSNALTQTQRNVFNQLSQLYQSIGAANSSAVTTTFGYDANGNPITVSAPVNRTSSTAYDALNRVASNTSPVGSTLIGYDALDQIISVTDPRNLLTSYTVNALGDLTQQVSPDTGTTINTYDSGGNLKTSKDARNKTSTYSYDALNRVTQLALGDRTITYAYDAGANGVGRLSAATDANHSVTYSYDPLGRVLSKVQVVGAVTKAVGYTYENGNLSTLTTPFGAVIGYSYAHGKVTGINVNGTNLLTNVLYEPFGPTSGWTWGNNTLAVRTYDTDGKVTHIDSAGLATYSYDDAFRITSRTDTLAAANNWTYDYDTSDRLTSATNPTITQGFTFDADGNRLTQTGTTATTLAYPSASNRLSSTTGSLARTYTYDNAGNVLSAGGITYTYYNNGRMKTAKNGSASAVTYTYNAFGERIKKSGTTRFFVYDEAGHLLGEYNSSGTMVQEFVWLGDIPVAVLTPNGTGVNVFYIHTDHLNTPRKITRPSDNKLRWTWNPDPYGNGAPNQNPQSVGAFTFNLRFPGQYFDAETGNHYNYFRDYDPKTGRYLQSDPIGLGGGVNTFSYVGHNPLAYRDSLGLHWASDLPSLPDWLVNGSAGIGASLSFGFTNDINKLLGTDGAVNKCSMAYGNGELFGDGVALLGGGGLAAKSLVRRGGTEWSHWIPDRYVRPLTLRAKKSNPAYIETLDNYFGWFVNGPLNGNYVSPLEHYQTDMSRFPTGWRDFGSRFGTARQHLNRVPQWILGMGFVSAAVHNLADDSNCGCY